MKIVTILGATGLIGSHLLNQLTEDITIEEIRVVVRRPIETTCSKIKIIQLDFSDHVAFSKAISGSDTVFCAIGTTRIKTPDLTAYRKVDVDIPVTAAGLCAENGVRDFHLVSSIGANRKSSNFYTRMKGEVEELVTDLPIPNIGIYRPSLLLGKRNETRIAEKISSLLLPLFAFLLPNNYKPIQATNVAASMIRNARASKSGIHIYHYNEMM